MGNDRHHDRVEHVLDTPTPIELYVENGSGSIELRAVETSSTRIAIEGRDADRVEVRQEGRHVLVVPPRVAGVLASGHGLAIEVTLPLGSEVTVKSGSADVVATGVLGATKVKSGSGDVELGEVGDALVVDCGSGDVRVELAHGELRVRSGSGDVEVDEARSATAISTGSGDVHLSRVRGPVVVKTGSGDLEIDEGEGDVAMSTGSGSTHIRTARRGRISSKGASGDVRIGVPHGTPVWTDVKTVTGRLHSSIQGVGQPEPGVDHVEVRATTVSGDVVLEPA